jgi:NADH dehydrogenase FAD-containing subunit
VKRVYGSHILLESGEKLHHDLLIWTGGVRANAAAESFAVEKEPRGRIRIGQDTACIFPNRSIPASERVYAIGDIACLMNPETKTPVLGAARPAIMQARIAADSVFAAIAREEHLPKIPASRTYRHRVYPYVVPIGGRYAITKIGPFIIGGFTGWLVKNAIEVNYFFSLMPFRKALALWIRGVRIFMKNDKLA